MEELKKNQYMSRNMIPKWNYGKYFHKNSSELITGYNKGLYQNILEA